MTQPATKPHPARPQAVRQRWWKRPWIVPLWAICGIFLAWRTPAYLGLTPEASLVELRSTAHYLQLSAHVVLGTVALTCCCLQVWPWLRQHHPRVHRISGRIYVAAVIPGSVLAVLSAAQQAVPLPGRVGNAVLAVLWLAMTLAGFHMARKRRFAEHRRWMIRSFALCFSIVVSRLWGGILFGAMLPFYDSHYRGDEAAFIADLAVLGIWLSWTVNLLIAEWWIERSRRPKARGRAAAVANRPDTPGSTIRE